MEQKKLQALMKCSAGRDHINTNEFATALVIAPQTARKNYCLTGECFGIRPIKAGRSLLWPVAAIEALLNGGA